MKSTLEKEKQKNIRRYVPAVMVPAVIVLLLALLLSSPYINNYSSLSLTDRISITEMNADNSISTYSSNAFPQLKKGNVLIVQLILPTDARFESDRAALVFHWRGATVKVGAGGKEIYDSESGDSVLQSAGDRIYAIPVPDDAFGQNITIRIEQAHGTGYSHFSGLWLMHEDNVRLFPMMSHTVSFYIFFPILTVSCVFLVFLLICALQKLPVKKLIFFDLFCLSAAAWYLGASQLLYVISDNDYFSANVEYFTLFLLPAFFEFYLMCSVEDEKKKRFFRACGFFFLIVFAVVAVLIFCGFDLHTLLLMFYLLLAAAMAVTIWQLVRLKAAGDIAAKIMRYGLEIGATLCILAVVLNILSSAPWAGNVYLPISSIGLSGIFIVIIIATSIISELIRFYMAQTSLKNVRSTGKLAYIDPLCAIPNRQAVIREIDKLDASGETEFTAFFFDADNLKRANDVFGHDVGDEFIRFTGDSIRNTFHGYPGFYGRYGGDEFVAFFVGRCYPEEICATFRKNVEECNTYHFFPFHASISVGYCTSSAQAPMTPEDALEVADKRMYESKRKNKAGRDKGNMPDSGSKAGDAGAKSEDAAPAAHKAD